MINQLILIKPGDIVLDYSGFRITEINIGALEERLGGKVKCVVRYIAPGIPRAKLVTPEEIKTLHRLGIAVLLVFEWSATRANFGGTIGLSDGVFSLEESYRLDYPFEVPLIMAIDTNTTPVNIEMHKSYSQGFDRGLKDKPVGIYGDSDIIAYCVLNGITVLNWLVGARSWGHLLDFVHVEQTVAGSTASYDMNIVHKEFYAWLPNEGEIEPMTPYVFQLANGGIGIRHESGSRSLNSGELEGPLKGETVYSVPESSNWEYWIIKELNKYQSDLEPKAPVGGIVAPTKMIFRGEGEMT